jgi:hypothetical protein
MFDRQIPAQHIRRHYKPDDYLAAVLIARNANGKTLAVKHEFATAQELASERRQAHFMAANAAEADLYLTVNALVPGTHNREKRDVQTIRHLYLDVDQNGQEILSRIMHAPQLPRPTTVIATSPGKMQVLWCMDDFEKDQAESMVRGMATEYGADAAVWDCARVLRIPGFRNCKYPETFYVGIIPGERSHRILTPADFPGFPEHKIQVARGELRQIPPGHHSMSEREWGIVMRRLERGEDTGAVESWLAREAAARAKPRPEEYAKRTVENAVRRLRERVFGSKTHSPRR